MIVTESRTSTGSDRVALEPQTRGVAVRDGVRLAWYRWGNEHPPGTAEILLLPSWSIVHSRHWKAQIPFLARHFRVTTFDGRGCGQSDRPVGASAYEDAEFAEDTIAVLDDVAAEAAVLVGLSCGATYGVHVAARHPSRVHGLLAIAPSCGFPISRPDREQDAWDGRHGQTRGWAMYNRHYWTAGAEEYDTFLRFFFGRMFTEPHSIKQIEDAVGWGHQIDARTLVDVTAGRLGMFGATCGPLEPICAEVHRPVRVIHGTEDAIRGCAVGERLAELTDGELLLVEGGGHGLPMRDPVLVNREIRAFAERVAPRPSRPARTWTRALRRRPRALYLSSPIGLGHARRDVAIADGLRRLHPDLQVDWLTQDPVASVLRRRGERVHPASAFLMSECSHIEDESGEHDLHAFQAIRRMDETLVANYMVFDDLVDSERYDLVVGDEAWEVDYFLHENPELKRSAYAWLTDFVGWLPMPDGGQQESVLTADWNAEMIEHRARFRGLRDRSVFVGDPGDVVDLDFGPGLPNIRDWTARNFDFAGHVTGIEPVDDEERPALRRALGYHDDERVCVVTVGGSGVGLPLLRRVVDAVPLMRRQVPDLRVVVVAGPRIDPAGLPQTPGLVVHGYLSDLERHLAVCDVAVVQGGLSTCMELTANRRPFVYVPLRHHFEQNLHVRHRLERHRAGRCLEYDRASDPDALAAAVLGELGREVDYVAVPTDGAARAALLLAELL